MAKSKLTDRQKKNIVAMYAECQSYSAVAKKYKISDTTVARIVKNDPETLKKVEDIKKQNTSSILKFLSDRREDAQDVIDLYLKELCNPERIKRSSTRELSSAIGVLVDKFIMADSLSDTAETDAGQKSFADALSHTAAEVFNNENSENSSTQ